ncbi:MAG TPA: hypothetical protein VIX82_01150 [Solirubrobacteraceae bacterium]
MTSTTWRLIDAGTSAWDQAIAGFDLDPYCDPEMMAAGGQARGWRPVLLDLRGRGWRAVHALFLIGLEGGQWLARTPEYGGPWLDSEADVTSVCATVRSVTDRALVDKGVVSQVLVLSPWVPHRDEVAATWGCRPTRTICLAALDQLEVTYTSLNKGRRADIARARRDMRVEWRPFGVADVTETSRRYGDAMDRLAAAPRWRLDHVYFEALAQHLPGKVFLACAHGRDGGAFGLFLVRGRYAAYVLAGRHGAGAGGSSAVLWEAQRQLAASGVLELLLGGGNTDDPDDPLLRFKRSLANRMLALHVGGICYDEAGHARAVAAGVARPLP